MRVFRHFCSGCVRVRLEGLSPERFFNLCGAAGIEVWDVTSIGGAYEFFIGIRDFFSCGPFAKKAKVRLRVQKKSGLPFFLYKNRARKLWALGLSGFFILLYALSLFVWDIEYQGNEKYTDDELGHFLESMEIGCGIPKSDVSCEGIEEALRNEFEGITWVSARLSGTRLYVHIKENEVPLEVPVKDETPCDLTAAYDGVITSIVVRSGIAMVKAGDTVEKGQVLVSGRLPVTDDSETVVAEHLIRADADVTARIRRTETKEIPVWHRKEVKTGVVRKGIFLDISGHSFVWILPDFKKTQWKTVTEQGRLRLFGDFYLPVDYGFITSFEVCPYDEKYTEAELYRMAENFKQELSENLLQKGVQIIENNVRILVDGSSCQFVAELLTEETIEERSTIN